MPFHPREYIAEVGKELILQFSSGRLATTPGLKGANREKNLRTKLSGLFPQSVSISSGVIIAADGSYSAQQDVVLSEKEHGIAFSLNGDEENSYFPCETTLATIEVKSELNPETLRDIIEKTTSVKKLPRQSEVSFGSLDGRPYRSFRRFGSPISMACAPQENFDQSKKHTDQILCLAFAGVRQISERYIKEILISALENDQHVPPDAIITLDGTIICWSSANGKQCSISPIGSDGVFLSEGNDNCFGFLISQLTKFAMSARTVPLSSLNTYFGKFDELKGRKL